MNTHGISIPDTEHAMRLLCLCTLAAQEPILTYARVAEALRVDRSEVEGWTIEAIGHGLLDATMDQLPETISIRSLRVYI
jgi:hypothetical protein